MTDSQAIIPANLLHVHEADPSAPTPTPLHVVEEIKRAAKPHVRTINPGTHADFGWLTREDIVGGVHPYPPSLSREGQGTPSVMSSRVARAQLYGICADVHNSDDA